MKIWKMVGCLAVLCVIVCACVVLGSPADAAAKESETEAELNDAAVPTQEVTSGQSETVKTYSEGLYFRSNGDGTCALAGMGSCTAACVLIPPQSPTGDTVVEILPYAFAGSIVGSVEIPTTVKALSALSFAECERLAYVRVAQGNESFLESDGALYTASGSVLLYCPAGRSASELKLHTALERVAAGAFAECDALDTVVFVGTTAKWHEIIVGDENNALYAARLSFVSP